MVTQQLAADSSINILRRVQSALKEFSLFLGFVAAYYLPLVLDNAYSTQLADVRIQKLLGDVLATPVVKAEIARNLCGHLLLLAIPFAILSAISRQLSALTRTAEWLMRIPVLVAGWVFLVASNSLTYPTSNYSIPFSGLARPELAYGLGVLLCLGLVFWLYRTLSARRGLVPAITIAASAFLMGAVAAFPRFERTQTSDKNVIIVGIDSLSASAFSRLKPSLPNLGRMMDSGVTYQRAYTPLGRTFPAWTTILSGKSPADHGAIFNLRNMEHVDKQDLISVELQSRGFRTVFAIDERRFNNMDQSFGFDHVVGPRAGAMDFLVQHLNDTPLSNLVMQTWAGRALMPFSYINTASHNNYDADGFVSSVLNKTAGAKRLFAAVHFESAHFPFKTRHATETFADPNQFWNKHAAALTVVDRQVGLLMAGLARQGHLKDALVILLSDHGEGLGETEANITLGGEPVQLRVYGHGTSVLSDHENHIVLGVLNYRNDVPTTASADARQVSLLDLKPMISRYTTGGDATIQPTSPCLFVETGIRLSLAEDYRTLDEANVAADSAGFYEIDDLGKMRLREDQLRQLADTKDIGVRCRDRVTYYSFVRGRHFTIGLDEAGVPATEMPPNAADIVRIESYRTRMLESLPIGAPYTP